MPNKAVILKVFTKELVLNSIPGLREKIKKKQQELVEFAPFIPSLKAEEAEIAPPEAAKFAIPGAPLAFQRIAGISFGKLTPLIQNPTISMIECPGPFKNIIFRTYNIRKSSSIILSKEEMQDIVLQFSRTAKIPIIEGLFRAWIDKFLVSAIVTNKQAANFIIQKVIYPHFA
jgi:hypothetical protein